MRASTNSGSSSVAFSNAAKSRLMRARSELRERLAKHCGTNGYGTLVHKTGQRRAAYVRAT